MLSTSLTKPAVFFVLLYNQTVMNNSLQKTYFAGGCFWGVEYYFQDLKGVEDTKVGYMGGHTHNPTYEEVCSGKTGHAETLEITFDPEEISFQKLAKLFFEIHDPTQINRQGPDIGDQYRSVIFYTNDDQKETAINLINILENKGFDIATQVIEAGMFFEAEDYHQKYYSKKGATPYCHFRQKRF